jgi:hypothetical protein
MPGIVGGLLAKSGMTMAAEAGCLLVSLAH